MPERVFDSVIHDPERLKALQRLNLLDTAPEEIFDRVTHLAAKLLDVPVARVALMGKDRMFCKSIVVGAPSTSIQADEPRNPSDSLVKYPVAFQETFLVEDARHDPRTKDNAAVRSVGIVGFAAVPLTDGDGHALGALCALDDKPRVWSAEQIATLQSLGGIIEAVIHDRAVALKRAQSPAMLPRPDGAGKPKLDGVDQMVHTVEEYLRSIDAFDQHIIGTSGSMAEGLKKEAELEEAVLAICRELTSALEGFQGMADGDASSSPEVQSAFKLWRACETYLGARQRRSETGKLFQQRQAMLDELRTSSQAAIAAEQALRLASHEYTSRREWAVPPTSSSFNAVPLLQ